MATGQVKWFNNAKGYGWITPADGEGDVFVHYSSIEMEGYKTLAQGETVTFLLNLGERGKYASKIERNAILNV